MKHANYTGIGKNGAVLALAGDDPSCKSSSLPQHSELMLWHLQIPTLYPGNVQDTIDFGLHGYVLSRAAGLWAALKIVTNVADGTGMAAVSPERVRPEIPTVELDGRPYRPELNMNINVQAQTLEMERTLYDARLELARRYARLNGLDRIVTRGPSDWLGILTAGKTYHDVRQALRDMGLGDHELRAHGIRILKMGMIVPMEPTIVREFADGLEDIFVIEEKRPFLELFAKEILYGRANAPRIVGKVEEEGRALLPFHGELDSNALAESLVARLSRRIPRERIDARAQCVTEIRELATPAKMGPSPTSAPAARTTARPRCRKEASSPPASAATRWRCG